MQAETYESQSAQDAAQYHYGTERYWQYLDDRAKELRDKYLARGDAEMADLMMRRTLSEALRGNDGD